MKKKISEVIVVEGKHDMQRLQQVVEADIIVSQGTHVSADFLLLCKRMNQQRGLIVFTDPDGPGEYIRRKIMEAVGDCKHASLSMKQARGSHKIGIEHATYEDLIEALERVSSFDKGQHTLSQKTFSMLGLSGKSDSQQRRDAIMAYYHLPKCNGKTCYKYLNMIGITDLELQEVMKGLVW